MSQEDTSAARYTAAGHPAAGLIAASAAPGSPRPAHPGAGRALRSLEDALVDLLAHAVPLAGTERVALLDADARVLAADVCAPIDVPGFNNSQMDGYAVRVADFERSENPKPAGALRLVVSQRIPAGHFGEPLAAASCARIFTGAPMPEGADAVVMQEDAVVATDGWVEFQRAPTRGAWVRLRGEDIAHGATVLRAGQRLGPAALGLAASMGCADVPVRTKPRVALFATGDELAVPGQVAPQDLKPGAIFNSNRYFVTTLLRRLGCEVTDLGIVPDDAQATLSALQRAAVAHDVIITSGGVSVGEEDHVKPAVQALGELHLWQVNMKPGKPFAYGQIHSKAATPPAGPAGNAPTLSTHAHFIGLPGNPVSSFVTFLLLVRPFLLALQGCTLPSAQPLRLVAKGAWPAADKRREFLRAQRQADGTVTCYPNQNSSVLSSMAWADGLVDNPAGRRVQAGETVNFWPLNDWLT